MKVLVIEDDDDKLEHLVQFVGANYDVENVGTAKSLQGGLAAVLGEKYDLVMLDMTMRNFDRTVTDDGGRPHAFAGREILRQMKRNKIDTPVIIVTNFDRFGDEDDFTTLEQLKAELEQRFPHYVGTVQYRSNVDEWQSVLKTLADRVLC